MGRSRWRRGLGRGFAAARLLGLRVRIPPGHGYLSIVSVVCCKADASATGRFVVQRSPTECGVSLSVIRRNNNPLHVEWVGRKRPEFEGKKGVRRHLLRVGRYIGV
jgi:hypothetical protein